MTLLQKLGIKPETTIALINVPEHYEETLGELPATVHIHSDLKTTYPFIQFFTRQKQDLDIAFNLLKAHMKQDGMLWISWPKGSSQLETDLNENSIREMGLAIGLVDVKVCAIDEDWSGLKFVIRVKDRTQEA